MYSSPLPISREKFKDLMHLKRFCNPVAKKFFESLSPSDIQDESDGSESESDLDDPDSN